MPARYRLLFRQSNRGIIAETGDFGDVAALADDRFRAGRFHRERVDKYIKDEMSKYEKIIKAANIRLD